MAKRRRLLKFVLGVITGLMFAHLWSDDEKCAPVVAAPPPPPASGLLLVGVMTTARYADTRARAVAETWGEQVPGRLLFFSSETTPRGRLPLVALRGVDDRYPPQKKSFEMLKYMHDHHIDQYEWFMRADDDVYVRTDRLAKLLRAVDSGRPWFIGQTGRGNSDEFGQLALENDENFCMGGPGVIMSRETLKRLRPHIDKCLEHLVTGHEDVELGRCVRKYVGIACTWSYEMQVILYHNQSGQAAFSGDLKQKEVHRAITLHPVKQPQYMYRLHKYFKTLKIRDYRQEMISLHREIVQSMQQLGYRREHVENAELVKNLPLFPEKKGSPDYLGDPNVLGVPQILNRYQPKSSKDVIEWEILARSLYSHRDLNPRKRMSTSMKEGLKDTVEEIMDHINSYSKQRGRIIDFNDILYGYWRLDPIHGVDLILDLLLVYRKYRGRKMTVQVRRHAYVQRTFTGVFVREIGRDNPILPNETQPMHQQLVSQIISAVKQNLSPIFGPENEPTINLILPLSGRLPVFRRFIHLYEDVCLKNREQTRLYVVLYKNLNNLSDYEGAKQLVETLQWQYGRKNINLIVIENENFARAKALEYGIRMLNDDDLMLFIDVDLVFDRRTLGRIRRNTIKGQSVYFPIVYSLYNPKLMNRTFPVDDYTFYNMDMIDETNGFWRQFGYGIASLYKSDYTDLGGLNVQISGWGSEDVAFYDNVIKSNLTIVRCVDPGLIHVYHSVNCDTNLDNAQKNMCLGTQASTLGSLYYLQKYYKKYEYLFR